MKKLMTGAMLLIGCNAIAQTGSLIKLPQKFSVSTKAWILQQYRNILPDGPILYRENLINGCGNNYGCQLVLPVTGLELTGIRINNETVKLNWKTYTEINNRGFDVERKFGTDGQFSFTAFIPGGFNSQTVKNYELMDGNNYEGITYYRLKQTDIDGRFNYSNTIAVKGFLNVIGIKPYPNPARADNVRFLVTGLKAGAKMSLTIYDNTGKRVYQKEQVPLTPAYTVDCKGSLGMAPGVYYISLLSENKKANATFVIVE